MIMKTAISVADLLFDVEQVPVEAVSGSGCDTRRIAVPGKKALVNQRTRHVLGVVGRNYRVVTNAAAIDLARSVCEAAFPGVAAVEWEATRAAAPGTLSYCFIDLAHHTHVLNYLGEGIGENDPFTPFVRVTNSFNGARGLTLTDIAARPPQSPLFQRDRHTIETRAGRWLKDLARRSPAPGFDLDQWITAWDPSPPRTAPVPGRN